MVRGWVVAMVWIGFWVGLESAFFWLSGPISASSALLASAWILAMSVQLVMISWDCTRVVLWLGARRMGVRPVDPVPPVLDPAQRKTAEDAAARLAVLVPAHGEVRSSAAADLFVSRMLKLHRATPRGSQIFLLFDSDQEQADNEDAVVARLRHAIALEGTGLQAARFVQCNYRRKPEHLRNKPGSIHLWLEEHGAHFTYMLVADADSSFLQRSATHARDEHAILRLLYAMEDGTGNPTLIQTVIHSVDATTWLGWIEHADQLAADFHSVAGALVFGAQAPCFGHNFICRVSAMQRCIRTDYLSHDMVESASMAAAGENCYLTNNVVTYESPEEPLSQWLKRDRRWAKGCEQWLLFLLRYPLPWRPRVYLTVSMLTHMTQIAACLTYVLATIGLSQRSSLMVGNPGLAPFAIGVVFLSSVLPRILAGMPIVRAVCLTVVIGWMSAGTMWIRSIYYLTDDPRVRLWEQRGDRARQRTGEAWQTLLMTVPSCVAGCIGAWMTRQVPLDFGVAIFLIVTVGMITCPLLGLLVMRMRVDCDGKDGVAFENTAA